MKPAVEAALQGYARRFLEKIDNALRARPQDRPQSIAEWGVATEGLTSPEKEDDGRVNLASLISSVARSDPDAPFLLAERHANGKGVEQDFQRSLKWYQLAAEQGHPDAQFALGRSFEKGLMGVRDRHSALEWYQRAGQQGHLGALTKLREQNEQIETPRPGSEAKMKQRSEGNSKVRAWHWSFVPVATLLFLFVGFSIFYDEHRQTRVAAERGNAHAQVELGLMYAEGRGVAQDDAEAVRWYRSVADQGLGEARARLEAMQ